MLLKIHSRTYKVACDKNDWFFLSASIVLSHGLCSSKCNAVFSPRSDSFIYVLVFGSSIAARCRGLPQACEDSMRELRLSCQLVIVRPARPNPSQTGAATDAFGAALGTNQ